MCSAISLSPVLWKPLDFQPMDLGFGRGFDDVLADSVWFGREV